MIRFRRRAKSALQQNKFVVKEVIEGDEIAQLGADTVPRRLHPYITDLETRQVILINRRFHRVDNLAFTIAARRFGRRDGIEAVDHPLHLFRHPAPGQRWMLMILGITGEGADANALIEKLDPIQAIVEQALDKISRNCARGWRADTGRIAGPPLDIPLLTPASAGVRAADRTVTALGQKVIFAIIATPVVADYPACAITESADMPTALAGLLGKCAQRGVSAHGWETIRINPRTVALPGHNHGQERSIYLLRNRV